MKRVASVKWGADSDILKQTYMTYVLPLLEYSTEVFVGAAESKMKPLDLVQNQALRIITGGVKTTPTVAMEVHTDLMPLQARREIAAINLHEKLSGLDPLYWDRVHHPAKKHHVSFLGKVQELKEKYIKPLSTKKREPISHIDYSIKLIQITNRTSIPGVLNKNAHQSTNERLQITKEYLRKEYPEGRWLHIYTDGASTPAKGNAGAGVFCGGWFTCRNPAGTLGSSLTGEVQAVRDALQEVEKRPILQRFSSVVLLLDSVAVIRAISSPSSQDSLVLECRQMIEAMQATREVVLQWIPAHCGLVGNSQADQNAKIGARQQQPNLAISRLALKAHVKEAVRGSVEAEWAGAMVNKDWGPRVKPKPPPEKKQQVKRLSRATKVATFRLDTGHDLLGAHLKRIGVRDSEICTLCNLNEPQDRGHLHRCTHLQPQRDLLPPNMTLEERESSLYWFARKLA
jgi:ribonuclease HI